MWQQQVLFGVVVRTVLLPVGLLWLWGHVLFPNLGVPGKLWNMRGLGVDDLTRRTINDVFINEQLVHVDSDNNIRDDQHQLYKQQRDCQPNSQSSAGPDPNDRWDVWKQQVMSWLAVWAVLFPIWILWLLGRVLFPDLRLSGEFWDM